MKIHNFTNIEQIFPLYMFFFWKSSTMRYHNFIIYVYNFIPVVGFPTCGLKYELDFSDSFES